MGGTDKAPGGVKLAVLSTVNVIIDAMVLAFSGVIARHALEVPLKVRVGGSKRSKAECGVTTTGIADDWPSDTMIPSYGTPTVNCPMVVSTET